MYVTSTARRGLIIFGVCVLAAVGSLGWVHRSAQNNMPAFTPPMGSPGPQPAAVPNYAAAPPAYSGPAQEPYYNNAQPVYNNTPPVYAVSPFGPQPASYTSGYVYGSSIGVGAPPPPPPPVAPMAESVAPAPPPRVVVERHYVYRGGRRYVVVHRRRGRPFSHSVAIVAGSAGAGALIGGLAGGGKGAGIGALAGGAGGLLYDRLTHK